MADDESRTYHIAFAAALSQSLPFSPEAELLKDSWKPGVEITRYNRTWRLSRPLGETDDHIFGRIGFVNEGDLATLIWDESEQDFVAGAASSGVTVPFAIRKSDLTIAYQLRPGTVRENTFTGALSALLNAGPGKGAWIIESYFEDLEYPVWRQTLSHVEKVDITVDRPNPHYADDVVIEDTVEGLHAERLRLVATARAGDDLNLDFPLIDQAVDHVLRGYGQARIAGETPSGEPSTWVKLRGKVASVVRVRSRKAVGPPEAPLEVLGTALEEERDGSQPSQARTVDEEI